MKTASMLGSMFWRRKKKEDPSEDPRAAFVPLSPDQVADALLGHEPEEGTAHGDGAQQNTVQPNTAQQNTVLERTAPSLEAGAASAAPASTNEAEGEEFYFEAEGDEPPSDKVHSDKVHSDKVRAAEQPQGVVSSQPPSLFFVPTADPAHSDPAHSEPAQEGAPLADEPAPVLTPHAAVTELLSFLNASPAPVAAQVQQPTLETITTEALASQNIQPVASPPTAATQSEPLPASNLDWNLAALRGVPLEAQAIVQAMREQWAEGGLKVQETDALRLARNAVVRVPVVLSNATQEFWVFVYPAADARSSAHFVAVERKANIFGAVAVYLAPTALALSGVEPAQLEWPVSASLSVWPADKPFPEGDYALWWPSKPGEHLANTEEGRLLTRIFMLQDEAASLLYGVLSRQLDWNSEEGMPLRRELPERTQYLQVMDSEGRPMILSAAQEKGVRLHLPRNAQSEARRGQWLVLTEQYLKLMVQLLLSAQQPLDTLWRDYETRPSQWWKAAQQVLDLRLDIGDNLAEIQVGHVAEEQAAEA